MDAQYEATGKKDIDAIVRGIKRMTEEKVIEKMYVEAARQLSSMPGVKIVRDTSNHQMKVESSDPDIYQKSERIILNAIEKLET